ncbi:hypothetical protein BN1013_00410 [Candidatus Rubidus massiliensis]|nr:hypothetical protein BN1013_00410 [Candidatus Rubidus massiliensis]
MNKDNIFDFSKSKKNLVSPPSAPKDLPDDDEIDAIFDKIHLMRNDLKEKVNDLLKHFNITAEEFEQTFNNPNNFTSQEWTNIKNQLEEFEKQVDKVEGKSVKNLKNKKEQNLKQKKAQLKTLSTKKNWIPMK